MEENDVRAKLTLIFRDIFVDKTLEIRNDMTAEEVPRWDLLSHINLVLAVEKGFGIRLTTREVRSLKNVGDFIGLIQRKAT